MSQRKERIRKCTHRFFLTTSLLGPLVLDFVSIFFFLLVTVFWSQERLLITQFLLIIILLINIELKKCNFIFSGRHSHKYLIPESSFNLEEIIRGTTVDMQRTFWNARAIWLISSAWMIVRCRWIRQICICSCVRKRCCAKEWKLEPPFRIAPIYPPMSSQSFFSY